VIEIAHFPVQIPAGFAPSDSEGDGIDKNSSGKVCPGYSPDDGYRPRWGGGMRAKRREHFHAAVDIMASEGAEIRSIGAGVVAVTWVPGAGRRDPGAGTSTKGGNYVVIETADGWRWYYAHLRDVPFVRPGQTVVAGQLLGYCGRTGNAVRTVRRRDGSSYRYGCPHLHLSLHALREHRLIAARAAGLDVIGRKVDPVALLKPLYDAGGWRR
jgi:murein DD-endopeptidase MepM/ murein hydrolase activator NlpD